MNHHRVAASAGFTLIEIMVALIIMAVIMIMAYNAFDGVLRLESRSKEAFLAENRRSLAFSIMLNDFLHMRARPARDQLGGVRPAYLAPSGDYSVEFTRGGLPDVGTMAGGIQRVAYRVEENKLIRTTWQTVDIAASTETLDQVLATGVVDLEVSQLDQDRRYTGNWPPLNVDLNPDALPPMVRIVLTTQDGDDIDMLIPGTGNLAVGERDP
jgi:general secretion pathway protein J